MPGSSVGIARRSITAPQRLCSTISGTALLSPPAPTSWIEAIGFALPRAARGQERGPEVAREIRAAELVVEARGADRPVEHDRKRRRDPIRPPRQPTLPRLPPARDFEVRDREAREPGFRLRTATGRALV